MKTISPLRTAIILSILAIALAIPTWAAAVDDGAAPEEVVLSSSAATSEQGSTAEVRLPWDDLVMLSGPFCDCIMNCFDTPYPDGCFEWCCVNEWAACRSFCY